MGYDGRSGREGCGQSEAVVFEDLLGVVGQLIIQRTSLYDQMAHAHCHGF